ncbi:MAG TPA: DUF4230 domain-containing protein [Anaeromyxobacteraceae bacterium]|nr:DUF4230 domain-containing protein [Anaeromyxobacteraceae bacterium]
MRRLLALLVFGLAVGGGAFLAWRLLAPRPPPPPDPPAVVERIREVARLETLEVTLYKKVAFDPQPVPAGSFWGDVAAWARYTLRRPRGKAIVFAVGHLGLDLDRLGPGSLRVSGREAWVALPPVVVTVELQPGETEVVGSNLDSAETAQLFQLAKEAFQRQVAADEKLRAKARDSARRAVEGLLLGLGFTAVHVVDRLSEMPAG